jgi:type I restriction enzyme S subunit
MKKLGETATFINGKAYKQEELLDYGKYRVLRVGNFFTNNNWYYSDLELGEDKYCDNGDLLYAWSASFGPKIWRGEKVIYHYHIWKVVPIRNINKDFLFILLDSETERMKTQNANGFALLHITKGTIENWVCYIPNSEAEQTKIADFLSLIDLRIEAQKQIVNDLGNLIKGLGVNLFSQRLRFEEFTDEWETKSLGEVADIKRGASPRPISDTKWFDENSKIGWVRISDITKSNKYLEETEQYLSAEGVLMSRLVPKDNIIMSICATIGKPIYTNFSVCIHDGFVVFENLQINKEYLYYYLDLIQLNWYKYGQPGTQINLNSGIVSNEDIAFPSTDEQTKIANFLSAFDKKLSIEQNLLAEYQNQKKYLLSQMFV